MSANPAYDQALTTGRVVVRKWFMNRNSTKNQITVQFQQAIERPTDDAAGANSMLISLEQGTDNLSKTYPTALRSFNATKAAAILQSMEGDASMGSPVIFADDLYAHLGAPAGSTFAIQVTENFEKNPYSKTQTPKSNPTTGEIVVATNPATGTQMPVYRHTELVLASNCFHTFIAGETASVPSQAVAQPAGVQPFAAQTQAPQGASTPITNPLGGQGLAS